ncbi:MAG: LysR substrate-binding domain-containing protein [Pseudomonadota bacterium]
MAHRRTLPPLTWFRTFEAAARNQSMTVAALDLGLTQPAVSQHIQLLEHRLGMRLFERTTKGLVLTDAGRRLLPQVTEAIGGLTRLVAEVDALPDEGRLTVAASASFTRLIIAPALPGFLDRHPEAQIRIRSTLWPDEFAASEADVEVRFGMAGLDPQTALPRCPDYLVAVCIPTLLSPTPDWAEISKVRLIQAVGVSETWESWTQAQGLTPPSGTLQMIDSHGLAIDLALQGVGVVLTNLLFAAPLLQTGRLIRPVGGHQPATETYFVVVKNRNSNPLAEVFADWINAAIAERAALAERLLHAEA